MMPPSAPVLPPPRLLGAGFSRQGRTAPVVRVRVVRPLPPGTSDVVPPRGTTTFRSDRGWDRMPGYVYDFVEGNKDLKDLLGGKGANLAEMTRMGLPVPPGFTITTTA